MTGTEAKAGNLKNVKENIERMKNDLIKIKSQHSQALRLASLVFVLTAIADVLLHNRFDDLIQLIVFIPLLIAFSRRISADMDLISMIYYMVENSVILKSLKEADSKEYAGLRSMLDLLYDDIGKTLMKDFRIRLQIFYSFEFIGLLNFVFILTTQFEHLSIQLQQLVSSFVVVLPISISIIIGIGEWNISSILRESMNLDCVTNWLEILKGIRAILLMVSILSLFLLIILLYYSPILLTPNTRGELIFFTSLAFGFVFSFLAVIIYLLIIMVLYKDLIYLGCLFVLSRSNTISEHAP
ncbi:hypothetical protein [Caldisphaera sp.]|uniref:hypothetical protein n=1 Tax=Caldisphaera sp. TaxID=2060322 RepID=UPI00397C90B5